MGDQLQQNTTAFTPKSLSGTSGSGSPLFGRNAGGGIGFFPPGLNPAVKETPSIQQLLSSFQQQQGFGTGFGGQNNEFSDLISSLVGQGQSLSK